MKTFSKCWKLGTQTRYYRNKLIMKTKTLGDTEGMGLVSIYSETRGKVKVSLKPNSSTLSHCIQLCFTMRNVFSVEFRVAAV